MKTYCHSITLFRGEKGEPLYILQGSSSYLSFLFIPRVVSPSCSLLHMITTVFEVIIQGKGVVYCTITGQDATGIVLAFRYFVCCFSLVVFWGFRLFIVLMFASCFCNFKHLF